MKRSVITVAVLVLGLVIASVGLARRAGKDPFYFLHLPDRSTLQLKEAPSGATSEGGEVGQEGAGFEEDFGRIADPNEDAGSIAKPYYEARALMLQGKWPEAASLLGKAIADFPHSRHLNEALAEIHWYYYKDREGGQGELSKSADYSTKAFEIGLRYGKVDYRMAELIAESLGRLGEAATLDQLFAEALRQDPNTLVHLQYAAGLAFLHDPRAENEFQRALDAAPEGNTAAREKYTEWLLEDKRYADALALLSPESFDANLTYFNFLRGVALERLGRPDEAEEEYSKHAATSARFPVPRRFQIDGSPAQARAGIRFEEAESPGPGGGAALKGSGPAKVTSDQTLRGLSFLVYKEAGGESTGGQRAEGWVVRNRVLRGTMYNTSDQACPVVSNGGTALADKYKSVMCQGNGSQFNGVCLAWCSNPSTGTCTQTTSTQQVAFDTFFGYAPDPVGGHCPGGIATWGGSWCASGTRCKAGTQTFKIGGGTFNYGTNRSCPSLCAAQRGKICGNGEFDNCFYRSTRYVRGGGVTYSGSINSSGSCGVSVGFSATSGTHKGHLEGPESTSNPDLDLYLQKLNGSTWSTVKSSARLASVEDIEYSGSSGTYRWRICSFTGTGSLALYTKRP